MNLTITSLSMESKGDIIALTRKLPARARQNGTEPNLEMDAISDAFDVKAFLDTRVRGNAFDSWWDAFTTTVLRCFRREVAAERGADESMAHVQKMAGEVWSRLGLSRIERELITFLHCTSCYCWLRSFVSDSSRWNVAKTIAVAIEQSAAAVSEALSGHGRLVRFGLIEYRKESERSINTLELVPAIAEFLSGVNWETTVSEYYSADSGATYSLPSFSVSERTTEILQSLLQSKTTAQLLLHGVPGTGKTEYARSLVRSLGKRALLVKHGREGKLGERRLSLQLAATLADRKKELLIVDEADMILNTGYRLFGQQSEIDKGWLNDFLDRCPAKVIWITNEISYIEESLLRRFTYNVRFTTPSQSKRLEAWDRGIRTHKLADMLPRSAIRSFASRYQLTPAAISSALSTLKRLAEDKVLQRGDIIDTLEEILKMRQSLLERTAVRPGVTVDDRYALEALNTDTDLDGMTTVLSHYYEKSTRSVGLNILFWGPPGTGKTEFARHLAAKVGVDLIDRKASALLSCYVGETEKNIRNAFADAENQGAILLLDEADSFLRERASANHSWEATQTNELLTNMETHSGVFICSTNLLDCLDHAAMRRFAWKVRFGPLKSESRLIVYQRYFPNSAKLLSETEGAELLRIHELTVGDFKAVWTKLSFLREGPLENCIILKALAEECAYRQAGKQIGFQ